jgi:hypothetical protein
VASTTADGSGNYSFAGLLPGSYTVTAVLAGYIFQPEAQVVSLSNTNATGVNFTAQVCTCISIWPSTTTPSLIDSTDVNSVEVGLKFTADSPAYVTGIRFYKASTNTGTHIGHIWDNSGNLLATATFVGESASGWQQVNLSTPVLVQANTDYIVSYVAPAGHYSADPNYFATSGVDRSPLHALANGVDGGNGVFTYTSTGAFPTNSFNATNYWVDIVYAAQPYNISGTITGGAGATVTLSGTSQATTIADASGNYSFTGIFGGNYSITPSSPGVIFSPGNQNVTLSQANVTGVDFTVPQICPCDTIWQPTATPAVADSTDPHAVEVGVKVRADADGYILGVRFYKSANNTGAHVGNLWTDPNGTGGSSGGEGTSSIPGGLLATANFANESASGWQQVLFPNPVPVSANTTYIASYFAPMGHYSVDASAFATANVDSPPLHALETGIDGGNGVFAYSQTSTLPTSTYEADNYWVDIIYAPTTTYTLAGNITGSGAVGATITLSGAANATTVSDANGNFSFGGLADGVYTVTPSEAGLLFSPASQTVTINGAHQLGINFVSGVPSYVVSGQVSGAPGIPVILSGATTTTVIADGSGNFTFPTVVNGNYTVTPASPGYAVTPLSQSITVNNAAVSNVNFSATVVTYSISGTITGGAGATVSLVGSTTTTVTADANGNYSFSNVLVGSYNIVPSMPGLVFNPGSITVVLNGTNITNANFAVPQNCPCDTIWAPSTSPTTVDLGDQTPVEVGVKFRADADAYIIGVRFYKAVTNTGTHVGHLWSDSGALLGTATFTSESTSGWQQVLFANPIPVSANTTYIASYFAPVGHYSADTYYFMSAGVDSPPLHALADGVDGPDGVFTTTPDGFPNQSFNDNATNYWVDVIYSPSSTYTVAGTIAGAGGPGATVTLSGAGSATTTADPSGNFSFSGLANGSYVVTPTESGYAYTPSTLNATINNAHALGLSFTSSGASYNITGTISGPGGAGATVTLSGTSSATTTADANGNYSFTALPNGSYTVTVSNTGYVFSPTSQAVTVNGANATAAFSSAAQTYTLSGNASGPGGPGATVTLTGASSATTTADGSGNFSFANLANGTYTVTVTNTGYAFTPPSQAVTVNGANATATFTSAAQTYTIGGAISGPGGAGATVTLTGAANLTAFANGSGVYSFTGVLNGSYMVTVANAGFVFTPASQAVTVNNANGTANFMSVAQTYSISGTISGAGGVGATVQLSGPASATTTANGSGAFTFTGLSSGTYTVAPSKTGYSFSPVNQAVTINGANATASFTSAATYVVSGTISGAGGNGALVTLKGATTVTTTASSTGAYSFSGVVAGSYTLTPTKLGYVFTPTNRAITVSNANLTENFSSTAATYTISGTISGSGASGVTVRLSGNASATTTTNGSGAYSFAGHVNGSYTVTPSKTGVIFTPANQAVTINNANAVANFTAAATYTISGVISGPAASGTTVTLSGASNQTVTTNFFGSYSFAAVPAGNYTVTPAHAGYSFTPANRSVTVSNGNLTENFSSAALTYTISGTISGPGGNGATVRLTGTSSATTTANSSGVYSFTGRTNGSYTVTPSKTGYTFSPASQNLTVNGANSTANFSSALQTYTLSGTISGAGGPGALITLSGTARGTTTANNSGAFTFTGLTNGNYTLTPSKSGHSYTPTNRSVTINGGNLTGVTFSSR